MSPTIQSLKGKRSLPLNLILSALMAVFTIGASVTAAYYTKGADATKLSNLERTVETNRDDQSKRFDELKRETVGKGEFDIWRQVYVESVQKDLNEIKAGVSQINQELLRQAQERKR